MVFEVATLACMRARAKQLEHMWVGGELGRAGREALQAPLLRTATPWPPPAPPTPEPQHPTSARGS